MHPAIRAALAGATTLATARGPQNATEEICAFKHPLCHRHDPAVEVAHMVSPLAICIGVQATRFMPAVLLGSRHRARQLKAALADVILLQIWLAGLAHLWARHRSLTYALSLHGAAALLHVAPRTASMLGGAADSALCAAGTAAIALYAWHLGPPLEVVEVGASDAGCGASVHLAASLAAEMLVGAGYDLLHSLLP